MLRTSVLAALLLLLVACDNPGPGAARSTTGNRSTAGGGQTLLTGVVNAPVAPEAIYIGLGGALPGVSVLDLNGFGQGTGDINNTRFPFNPNIGAPGVVPALAPGTSNIDAGGAGVLTMTRDTNGGTRLLGSVVGDVADIQIGQPLDLVFHDGNVNPYVSAPNQVNPITGTPMAGNTIMVAPHPNPPRLVFPPPNPAMGIEAEEPTVASTQGPFYAFLPTSPPCLPSPLNLLVLGNPFSSQQSSIGIFGAAFPGVFYGPQPPPSGPPQSGFRPYVSRQQVGHFLYVIDRAAHQIVVVNSNRFTVLAGIAMPDPVDLAMAPNLELLAVSNATTGEVRFLDTKPSSPTFHQVVAQTQLAPGITKMAWQPEGEDLLVINPMRDTLTLIAAPSLQIRKTLSGKLHAPVGLAVSARLTNFGAQTGTWFAFVLNGDGSVAVFESGPAAIGYDDVLGTIDARFPGAAAIRIDAGLGAGLGAGFWVAHRDEFGLGQVSKVQLTASPFGPLPTTVTPPGVDATQLPFRQKEWTVVQRFGGVHPTTPVPALMTGNAAIDIAFDDIFNFGALPDQQSAVVAGLTYANHSGKGLVKNYGGTAIAAHNPIFMFVAFGDTGTVDTIEVATGARFATTSVPGIQCLCDYWRQ